MATETHAPSTEMPSAVVLLKAAQQSVSLKSIVYVNNPKLLENFLIEDGDGQALIARHSDLTITLMQISGPLPEPNLPDYCNGSLISKDTWPEVKSHLAHVFVHSSLRSAGNLEVNSELAKAATFFTMKFAAALGGVGIFWPSAQTVFPAPLFSEALRLAEKDGSWPVAAMVAIVRLGISEGVVGVATTGLLPYTGYELALAPTQNESPKAMIQRMLAMASWVLRARPHLADGDTMGSNGGGVSLIVRSVTLPGERPAFLLISP